jgi:WD40 repeat protein
MTPKYKLLHKISGLPDDVSALSFSRSGTRLAIGCDSGFIAVVDVTTGKISFQFICTIPVTALMWHPFEDEVMIAGYRDASLRLYKLGSKPVCFSQVVLA